MLCPAGSVSEECPARRRKKELVSDEEDAALEEEAAAWRVLALGGIPMGEPHSSRGCTDVYSTTRNGHTYVV